MDAVGTERDGMTRMPPKAAVDANGAGPAKRPEYYPERYMLCSKETLENWRRGLEGRIAGLEAEIEKLRGGIDQIDGEFARRAAAKGKR